MDDLNRFSKIEADPETGVMGTHFATILLFGYVVFLVYITHSYVKTKFEKKENKDNMMTIVGIGLGFSAPIYASLLIPGIPWIM